MLMFCSFLFKKKWIFGITSKMRGVGGSGGNEFSESTVSRALHQGRKYFFSSLIVQSLLQVNELFQKL